MIIQEVATMRRMKKTKRARRKMIILEAVTMRRMKKRKRTIKGKDERGNTSKNTG